MVVPKLNCPFKVVLCRLSQLVDRNFASLLDRELLSRYHLKRPTVDGLPTCGYNNGSRVIIYLITVSINWPYWFAKSTTNLNSSTTFRLRHINFIKEAYWIFLIYIFYLANIAQLKKKKTMRRQLHAHAHTHTHTHTHTGRTTRYDTNRFNFSRQEQDTIILVFIVPWSK